MIHQIRSDLETFKTLNFKQGLNILLADKSENATDRHTRNGAGKSSLVELINFLCASNVDPESIFRSDALINFSFDMDVDIGGERFTIERSGEKPANIKINGNAERLPIAPKLNKITGIPEISNVNLRHTLGNLWFGLDAQPDAGAKYHPTFRSLFSYFARRQESGGFQTHTQHAKMQQKWDWQIALSYFLGLDWQIPQKFQKLKDNETQIKNIKLAADSGALGVHFEKVGALTTRLTLATKKAEQLRKQLDGFEVIPEYREHELEANKITGEINQLGEENFIDRRIIDELNLTLKEEYTRDSNDLIKLYEEAQVVLPDSLKKRLDAVKAFHKAIIKNRHSHLSSELASVKQRIEDRDKKMQALDTRKSQIMRVLKSGGALEQYTLMHEALGWAEAEVKTISQRLETAETLENSKAKWVTEQNILTQALRDDIFERGDLLREAILKFEELSQYLYKKEGRLIINAGNSGPTFEVEIDNYKSKGINSMQIFCFDLMLMELCSARGQSPGFLVHDSHLFDGVDERQVAKALQFGAERAKKAGFQYIVTMNSDKIPMEYFDQDFNVNDYVLRTKLTDATASGGLFGIRF